MLGRTHLAAGVTTALLLNQPVTLTELVLGTGAAAIGAVISDIDSGTSTSHKDADRILGLVSVVLILLAAAEHFLKLGIYERLAADSSGMRVLLAVTAFILICAFGKEKPHRTFMHSLSAMGLLCACMAVFLPMTVPFFAPAFLSHLGLDFLNRKGEQLLYPLPMRFRLNLCPSDGRVNRMLFRLGTLCALSLFVFYTLELTGVLHLFEGIA